MLGYVALLFLLAFSVKAAIGLQKHRPVFAAHGVTSVQISVLQFSLLLYALSLVAFTLPVYWLRFLSLLLLAPGIVLGRRIAARLDVGNDAAVQASGAASNAFWLGVAALLFIVGNIIVRFIFRSFGG